MDNVLAISEVIKRHIKMRGYTINRVSEVLGINYKTFDGILNRDAIDAKLLFKLANLLNIDLCWMAQLYEKRRPISFLEQYQLTRMSDEMKEAELKLVLNCLDRHILENPNNISEVKNALIRDFNQLFYLLDVLLPEKYIIRIAVERGKERYYCMPVANVEQTPLPMRARASTQFYEGHEMLKQLIYERMTLNK